MIPLRHLAVFILNKDIKHILSPELPFNGVHPPKKTKDLYQIKKFGKSLEI